MAKKQANRTAESDFSYISEQLRPLAVPISSLNEDPANVRKHPRKNLDATKSSLKKFGQRLPIVVQKQGMIVRAGNGRLQCARELGWTFLAAVIVDEEDVDAIAFAIADNRSGELAEWDYEGLSAYMGALREHEVELPELGCFESELKELLETNWPSPAANALDRSRNRGEGEDDDENPDVEKKSRKGKKAGDSSDVPPSTMSGDTWLMGTHRLVCGKLKSKDRRTIDIMVATWQAASDEIPIRIRNGHETPIDFTDVLTKENLVVE
jgi:hypothetical protein